MSTRTESTPGTQSRESVPFRVRTADGDSVELTYSSPREAATHDELAVLETLPWFERGHVDRAKPEPDLFLTCAERIGISPADCYVVGDAVWDLLAARRAGMLSVGLLSGGYGEDELTRAGAFRVYRDAAELHMSLDAIGVLS